MKMKMKMSKRTDQSSQHSGHDDSKSQAAPTMAGKPKAPASTNKPAIPAKEGAGTENHDGHSPAHKSR